ncbi:MAG: hypothetical protein NC336_09510 [Clostridium sp.]|nr:hypothetical protein [Clostridium sp.]
MALGFSQRQIDISIETVSRRQKAARQSIAEPVRSPKTGQRKFLVILVEYADVKFTHGISDFDTMMNEPGYTYDAVSFGSVRDYYLENSFGQLDLATDVVRVYTLPNTREYYGSNRNGNDQYAITVETESGYGVISDNVDFTLTSWSSLLETNSDSVMHDIFLSTEFCSSKTLRLSSLRRDTPGEFILPTTKR